MNQELKDIFQGIKRSLLLVDHSDKIALLMASAIMLITGLLTNWPAIILGNFVDTLLGGSEIHFESAELNLFLFYQYLDQQLTR